MKTIRKAALSCGVSLTVIAAASGASAQAAPASVAATPASTGLEEVIVTAQRRAENIQNVPIAVTSFSASALAAQQVTNTLDIARLVPGFVAANNVGLASANVYYIRGLGQTQSFPTFEPQVGSYVDDIYIARQNTNNLSLFGVQSIQVLRGPQGTLFGRNSTGGAVVVTLQKPASSFGGSMEVGYGAFNQYTAKASVDIPISDQILTRTSAFVIKSDGYAHDLVNGQKYNGADNWGVREAVTLKPANYSNVEWNLSADFSDTDQSGVLNQPNADGSERITYTGYGQDGDPLAGILSGKKAQRGQGVDVESWGFMSNMKIGFSAGTLNIITGLRALNQKNNTDFPYAAFGPETPYDSQSPIGQFALAQDYTGDQYSQEFKWTGEIGDKLKYTGGIYYLFETNRDNFGAAGNIAGLIGVPGLNYYPAVFGDEFTKNQTQSDAGYLQADYKVTDALTVTIGGRLTHEVKTVAATPAGIPSEGFTTDQIKAAGYSTHLSTDQFTPHVSAQYQFNPDLMVFASATRGFQGGGWNGLAFTANTFNDFKPETVWSYETGFRSETSDHRLRFNTTLFYEDVHNYQLLSDVNTGNGTSAFNTTNAASYFAYGADLEATWRPIDPLTISGNIGLLKAAYFDQNPSVSAQQAACVTSGITCSEGIVNAAGRLATPSYAPPFKSSITASYDWDFEKFMVTPTASVEYSARYNPGTEGSFQGLDKPYTLIDLGATFQLHGSPWKLTAECRNCTMVDYGTSYLFGYKYYNTPGVWDVKIDYAF
jgi:iron complex outermembrane receptor protein